MIKLTPTMEEIEGLRKILPPGPVVMVNLLKFKPDGGREAYSKYMEAAFAVAPPGLKVLYSGKAGPDLAEGVEWDFVILVEYPNFDAVASAFTHPAYQSKASPLRPEALERTLCMVSFPSDLSKILE